MAIYNKPGTYVQEVLTAAAPIAGATGDSIAAFIGYADRGPTALAALSTNNVISTPVLVTNFDDFATQFAFSVGNDLTPFDPKVDSVFSTNKASATALKYAVKSFFDNGGTQAYIVRNVNKDAALAESAVKDSNIYIAQAADWSFDATNNAAVTASIAGSTTVPKANIANSNLITVSSVTSPALSVNMVVSTANAAIAPNTIITAIDTDTKTITLSNNTLSVPSGSLSCQKKILSIGAVATSTFSTLEPGRLVTFSGVDSASNYAFLNGKTWVVSDVSIDGKAFAIYYTGSTYSAAAITGTAIKINGTGAVAPTANTFVPTLSIAAKNHGAYGNYIWTDILPSSVDGYFDVQVYYSLTATQSSDVTSSQAIPGEYFALLSMNSADPRYAPNIINSSSSWITVTDKNSGGTGYMDLPYFTALWSPVLAGTGTNGAFVWSQSATTSTIFGGGTFKYATPATPNIVISPSGVGATSAGKIRIGVSTTAGNTAVQALTTAGSDGSINADFGAVGSYSVTDVLPRLDPIDQPLIINAPNVTAASDVNKLMGYAANRGDSFVIIDPVKSDGTAATTSADVLTAMGAYTTKPGYGAVYYPYITVPNAYSVNSPNKNIAPGGQIAALFASTDANRGVQKTPAGFSSTLNALNTQYPVSNSEYDSIYSNGLALNVIRNVTGSGVCVMGGRTLSKTFSDRYISVRRSVNYLAYNLRKATEFAVFEPNDQNLWSEMTAAATDIVDQFWREGGLKGVTAEQAYYVKCDSTNNTTASIAAGEVRLEVGVALQRPAEFVIITIGQVDGGSTISTSV